MLIYRSSDYVFMGARTIDSPNIENMNFSGYISLSKVREILKEISPEEYHENIRPLIEKICEDVRKDVFETPEKFSVFSYVGVMGQETEENIKGEESFLAECKQELERK